MKHPYNPLVNNSIMTYKIFEITGHLVQISTGQVITTIPTNVFDYRIDVLNKVNHANSPQSGTAITGMECEELGVAGAVANYNTTEAHPDLEDNRAIWTGNGVAWDGSKSVLYIGEVRNQNGNFMLPAEPQLPYVPVVGQVLDVYSSVFYGKDNPTIALSNWRCSLYVLAHLTNWKIWSDCWITVLTERSGTEPNVFEYVYAKDIGLVDLWYGRLTNGQIIGYEQVLQP